MVTNICLLLEALSFVFCLHCLYGEKFKLDIATTSLLAIDMIVMTVINYYGLSKVCTMIIYPIMVIYCGIRFGFQIKEMVANVIICAIVIGVIQSLTALPIYYLFKIELFSGYELLFVNCIAFIIVWGILPRFRIDRIVIFLKSRGEVFVISLITCLVVAIFWLISYKEFKVLELNQAVLLLISLVFALVLMGQLSEYKVKTKEVETELRMHKLYADSLQGLIENIRARQHEFDNHINTLYSQHYIYSTYDELVKAQNAYCQLIIKENRFNKLLTISNSVIISFLYIKFIEIDKQGIDVKYKISISSQKVEIPDYKIIEILGNLIQNAVEALDKEAGSNKLFVLLIEEDNFFEIEVRNESSIMNLEEIATFFDKGVSKKGEGRGLGLYNVKCICEKYMLDILFENRDIEGQNWLSFRIRKKSHK